MQGHGDGTPGPADRYAVVVEGFSTRLEGVKGGWPSPSPYDRRAASDVAVHVVELRRRVLAIGGGSVPDPIDADAICSLRGLGRSTLSPVRRCGLRPS